METREIGATYRLEEVLSATPLSTVRRAVESATGLVVAVKLLHSMGPPINRAMQERFLSTMERLRELAPPAFPGVVDFGLAPDKTAFVVMEYVDGVPMGSLAPLAPARALSLLEQVARVMEPLAAAGLSHHNLCPDNILVASGADGESIRILGFGTTAYLADDTGVAPLGRSPEAERFTAGEILGPETPDPGTAWRADLYSLALIACALLRADVELAGSPRPEVLFPADVARSLEQPTILAATLAVALREDPGQRSLSFAELAQAFADARGTRSGAPEGIVQEPWALQAEEEGAPRVSAPPGPPASARAVPRMKVRVGGRDLGNGLPDADAISSEEMGEEAASELPSEPFDDAPAAVDADTPAFDPEKTDPMLILPPLPESLALEVAATSPADAQEAARDTAVPPADTGPIPVVPLSGPAASPAATVVAPAPPSRPAARGRPVWVWVAAAVTAVALLGAVALVAAHFLSPKMELGALVLPTAVPPTPVPPTRPPEVTPNAHLQQARQAFEEGDTAGARQALQTITEEEVARFSPDEEQLYAGLRRDLAGLTRDQAVEGLRRGLRSGDVRALGDAVATLSKLSRREVASVPHLKDDLDRGREALRVQALMWRAQRAGDPLETLQRAAELVYVLPAYARAAELRQEAGRQVMALAREDLAAQRYDRGIERLEAVQRSWPEAPDIAAAVAHAKDEKAADERVRALLAEASAEVKGNTPEKGLALLDGVAPGQRYAAAFAETREALKKRLAELDAKSPTVAISPGFDFKYKKNEVILVPVQIHDDHGVASARAMVRTEGHAEYRPMTLKHTEGDRYVLELPPGIHGNDTVEFYLLASDDSGHTTSLGSSNQPLQIKRKHWFGF